MSRTTKPPGFGFVGSYDDLRVGDNPTGAGAEAVNLNAFDAHCFNEAVAEVSETTTVAVPVPRGGAVVFVLTADIGDGDATHYVATMTHAQALQFAARLNWVLAGAHPPSMPVFTRGRSSKP